MKLFGVCLLKEVGGKPAQMQWKQFAPDFILNMENINLQLESTSQANAHISPVSSGGHLHGNTHTIF